MLATVLHGAGDVRYEDVAEPRILRPTDAIIKLSATCICGSDLWPYRGLETVSEARHMGHEYCGVVVEVGSDVKTIKPGQFVVGSFATSDNVCPGGGRSLPPVRSRGAAKSHPQARRPKQQRGAETGDGERRCYRQHCSG